MKATLSNSQQQIIFTSKSFTITFPVNNNGMSMCCCC